MTEGVIEDRITVTASFRCDGGCGQIWGTGVVALGYGFRYDKDVLYHELPGGGRCGPVRFVEPADDPQPTDASREIANWVDLPVDVHTLAGHPAVKAAGDALVKALGKRDEDYRYIHYEWEMACERDRASDHLRKEAEKRADVADEKLKAGRLLVDLAQANQETYQAAGFAVIELDGKLKAAEAESRKALRAIDALAKRHCDWFETAQDQETLSECHEMAVVHFCEKHDPLAGAHGG